MPGSRSDIDLAIVSAGTLPTGLIARVREELEEAPIPFRTDVIEYRSAAPELRQTIDREGIEWIE